MRLTHVGGPTVLVEVDGWRILTDPNFDAAGGTYGFGWGSRSTKTGAPALAADDVRDVDVVLLSHDHHADNLDGAGRALLPRARTVVTTRPGARRLARGAAGRVGPEVRGLDAGETTVLSSPGLPDLTVTATPCRHGPPLSLPISGRVIGFAVSVADRVGTALWMTGDTVLTRGVLRSAAALDVDVALVHLGGVRFGVSGPLRYSMTGADAVRLLEVLRPRVAVPVHYEGWSHFAEPPDDARRALATAPAAVRDAVVWAAPGTPHDV